MVEIIRYVSGGGTGVGTSGRHSQIARVLQLPDWRKVYMPPFQKDVYREHIATAQRPMNEVEAYQKTNYITVSGRGIAKPILHIDEACFPEVVSKAVEAINPGSAPSAIEAQCWPVALKGKDLVAVIYDVSKGHTLAYLIPAIIHILRQPSVSHRYGPLVLVLIPTREAALRFRGAAGELNVRSGIRVMYLRSGEPREPQLKQIEEGAHICVATPSRLLRFMEESKINLVSCTYLVLDEADRMMTMGFEKQLRVIAENIRPDRQTLVWLSSRTMDTDQLIQDLTNDCVTVSVGAPAHVGHNRPVQHILCICEQADKEAKLIELLNDMLTQKDDKAIVFADKKKTVEELVLKLRLQGWTSVGIHGKKTEHERQWALNTFQFGTVPILVATDLVVRALSVDKVRFIISYEYPIHASEYPRRWKYAARPDGSGVKCTFLAPDETLHAKQLLEFLRETKQRIPPQLSKIAKRVQRSRRMN
ncbi:hypothetical protein MTO96_025473 [Rhipicephalus appendiculatus]